MSACRARLVLVRLVGKFLRKGQLTGGEWWVLAYGLEDRRSKLVELLARWQRLAVSRFLF